MSATGNAIQSAFGTGGAGFTAAVKAVTSAYLITTADYLILGDATGGNFTVTLPDATTCKGQVFIVENFGGSGTVTIGTAGGKIGGSGGGTTFGLFFQFQALQVQSDGVNWQITGQPITQGSQSLSGNKQFSDGIFVSNGVICDGFQPGFAAKSANYTMTDTDCMISATGTITITLDTAHNRGARLASVKNVGAGTVTVATQGGQTIDGAATFSLAVQWSGVTLMADNNNWLIIAKV